MKFQEVKTIKEYILSHITEEAIFSYYMEIPISDIIDITNKPSKKVRNKHRFEQDASITFKYTNKLRMIDYGNRYWCGDCFHIAGIVLRKDCNDSQDFRFILNHIIENIIKQNTKFIPTDIPIINRNPISKLETIDILTRNFSKDDYNYFFQYNLRRESLNNIFAIENYWLDGVINKYEYTKNDSCYAYYLGEINNRILWKLYFPLRDKKTVRFITNNDFPIENINEVKCNHILILTKSQKDKRLLKQIFKDLKITTVDIHTLSSESVRLSDKLISYLRSRYNIITTFLDNDKSGIEASNYMEASYNMHSFFLKGQLELPAKDISDISLKCGYIYSMNLIKETYINLINTL